MHLATFKKDSVVSVSEEAARQNTDYRVDINTELSDQNYNLLKNSQPLPPDQFVEKRLSEVPHNKRKDLIVMDDWCIQLPPELRNVDGDYSMGLTDEQKKFFEGTVQWGKEKYGAENLIYAIVHVDETTPHIHLAFVPVVEKDDHTFKISNTDLHPRNMMYGNKIHAEAEKFLVNYMDRPLTIRNNATHKEQSAELLKFQELAEQTRQAEKVLAGLNAEIEAKQKPVNEKKTEIPLVGKVIVDASVMDAYEANKKRLNGRKARRESPYSEALDERKRLRATNKGLNEKLEGEHRVNQELSSENARLQKQLEHEQAENALLHLPHDREYIEDESTKLYEILKSQKDIVDDIGTDETKALQTAGYELYNSLFPIYHEPTMTGTMNTETGEAAMQQVEPDSLDNAFQKRKKLKANVKDLVNQFIPYVNGLDGNLSYGLQQKLYTLRDGIRTACKNLLSFADRYAPERTDIMPDKQKPIHRKRTIEIEDPPFS